MPIFLQDRLSSLTVRPGRRTRQAPRRCLEGSGCSRSAFARGDRRKFIQRPVDAVRRDAGPTGQHPPDLVMSILVTIAYGALSLAFWTIVALYRSSFAMFSSLPATSRGVVPGVCVSGAQCNLFPAW